MTGILEPMHVGLRVRHVVTITADMVRLFADVTGDDAPHHLDERYAAATALERPIVHGALTVGLVSTASTRALEAIVGHFVSAGYDGIRFRRPLHVGDDAVIDYEVVEVDASGRRCRAHFTVRNAQDDLCATGEHLMTRIDEVDQPGHA